MSDADDGMKRIRAASGDPAYEEARDQALIGALVAEGRGARAAASILAYPFFSLTKKRRSKLQSFTSLAQDVSLSVAGTESFGVATIYDADVLFWLAAEFRRLYDDTGSTTPRIAFHPHALLRDIGRGKGGSQTEGTYAVLDRLTSTYNKLTFHGAPERTRRFHWLDRWHVQRDLGARGSPRVWSVVLSDYLVEAALQNTDLLALSADYYRLQSAVTKRLYQIAIAYAGRNEVGFVMSMDALRARSGSSDEPKQFAYKVRQLAKKEGRVLDYLLSVLSIDGEEKVWFRHISFALADQTPS
ncbi:MAG: replication initiator protein A [Trueperaceae bacterium]|nr:replication initiator protein A [Trueperaceae bacterium]